MCFYSDPDWYASLCTDEIKPLEGKPRKCYECSAPIAVGQLCRQVYMQQNHPDEWEDGDHEEGEEFRTGETFSCTICEPCTRLLECIQEIETEAGCQDHESQPMFGELSEAMHHEPEMAWKYADRFRQKFPQFAGHNMVARVEKTEDDDE